MKKTRNELNFEKEYSKRQFSANAGAGHAASSHRPRVKMRHSGCQTIWFWHYAADILPETTARVGKAGGPLAGRSARLVVAIH